MSRSSWYRTPVKTLETRQLFPRLLGRFLGGVNARWWLEPRRPRPLFAEDRLALPLDRLAALFSAQRRRTTQTRPR